MPACRHPGWTLFNPISTMIFYQQPLIGKTTIAYLMSITSGMKQTAELPIKYKDLFGNCASASLTQGIISFMFPSLFPVQGGSKSLPHDS